MSDAADPVSAAHLTAELATLRRDLYAHFDWKVSQAQQTVVKELVSAEYLTTTLDTSAWIPTGGGWAASYEIIATLVARVLASTQRVRVLELGSGVSTVWLGLAMRQRGAGHITSFEHDPVFHRRLIELTETHGIAEHVDVVLAPLVPDEVSADVPYWYDLSGWRPTAPFDILFVDGPPGSGGPEARYPAYPRMREYLANGALVVLDDVHRADESAIIARWQALDAPQETLVLEEQVGYSALLRYDPSKVSKS